MYNLNSNQDQQLTVMSFVAEAILSIHKKSFLVWDESFEGSL